MTSAYHDIIKATILLIFASLVTEAVLSIDKVANYSGDIILGVLVPIHERGDSQECGQIQEEDGIMFLEAVLFTLNKINHQEFFPNFTLGIQGMDTCSSESRALKAAVEMIRPYIIDIYPNHQDLMQCENSAQPHNRKVAAVIGAMHSSVTIQIANLLTLFKIPQVSYLSTSPTLSSIERFPYFTRTVPSDVYQAYAIIRILREFNWTYVSAVYDDSNYGIKGFSELKKLTIEEGICFAVTEKLQKGVESSNDAYDYVIRRLNSTLKTKVVIAFVDMQQGANLMKAAKRLGTNEFIWVGSDGWSGRSNVVNGVESTADGAITVQPLAHTIDGFHDYFTSLTLDSRRREHNPWLGEYWEHHFKCKLPEELTTRYNNFSRNCTGSEDLSNVTTTFQMHFIQDAVYAIAHALRNMHRKVCGRRYKGVCPQMREIEGEHFIHYLKNVAFTGADGEEFVFLNEVDGPPRYTIMNFKKNDNGKYVWATVGTYALRHYQEGEGGVEELYLNYSELRFRNGSDVIPDAVCSLPCQMGQAIQMEADDQKCCWVCVNCTEFQYLPNQSTCTDCPLGSIPNAARNVCVPIVETYMSYSNTWGKVAMSVACIGILLAMVVAIIFLAFKSTPLVKASGRELSAVLWFGIVSSYGATFVFVAKPTPVSCAVTRFLAGFCYTICYGAILVKTNRISRIFNARNSTPKKTPFTSPLSQIFIIMIIIFVYIVIAGVWLTVVPPQVENIPYPTRAHNLLICKGAVDTSYLVGFAYPFILIILCTVYAFKTRKCPAGFNETRYIAFTNYTTCIIWMAFMPMYFANPDNAIRVITLCLGLSMGATVALFCLFFSKAYVVLLRPEKNTKESVMSSVKRSSSSYLGSNQYIPNSMKGSPLVESSKTCKCGCKTCCAPKLPQVSLTPNGEIFRRSSNIASQTTPPKVCFRTGGSDDISDDSRTAFVESLTEPKFVIFDTSQETEL